MIIRLDLHQIAGGRVERDNSTAVEMDEVANAHLAGAQDNGNVDKYIFNHHNALSDSIFHQLSIGFYGKDLVNPRSLSASLPSLLRADQVPVEWLVASKPVDYAEAVAMMEARAEAIAVGKASDLIWLVEHPPIYTAGTSADDADLNEARFPVHRTGRGGQFTYHGPGQRVAYVMLDLTKRGQDVRRFVMALEAWVIASLDAFNITGERREDRVGVWVKRPDKGAGFEDKIAAIGIRVRRWVTFHGISLNVEPDLSHFSGIVPCGISEARYGVTSLVDLGLPVTMDDADAALKAAFIEIFGPISG